MGPSPRTGHDQLTTQFNRTSNFHGAPPQKPMRSTLREAKLDKFSQITIIRLTMTAPNRIVIDPAICHGKPVIRGTRLPVTVIVGSLAGGMTFEDVQREYDVTADDIRAALRFVGELAEQESFHPLPAA
jgi:uncharacterized protein (DUF433 family)